MSDISVNYRYINNIERFFPIFPRNDFYLQKSCRDGPTSEISMIYRRYFARFLTLHKSAIHEMIFPSVTFEYQPYKREYITWSFYNTFYYGEAATSTSSNMSSQTECTVKKEQLIIY